MKRGNKVEARVGFEPTNGGFADLSLGPLGYRANQNVNSITERPIFSFAARPYTQFSDGKLA
jgi:hypothetical protein